MSDNPFPRIGQGTWSVTDPAACVSMIKTGLEIGYRHVDTARAYGNEHLIGTALAESEVPREEVLLATKVGSEELAYEDVIAAATESCEALGVDTIDLLYVHSPRDAYEPSETLAAFDELIERDVIRAIGLSNFTIDRLEAALEALAHDLTAHQVETHPLLQQPELVEYARTEGFHHVAHTPLARGRVLEVDLLQEIAAKHETSPAAVSLAWLLQRGVDVIPRSTDPDHLRENFAAGDLSLDPADIERIDALRHERRERVNYSPTMT